MRLDTKGRVAIDAILDIAIHGTRDPVCLADIGKRQHVSVSYLEHLFKRLRQSGFVASFRGPGGGYRLKRGLATISVADVICAVDSEGFNAESTAGGGRWPSSRGCATDGLWRRVDDQLRDYLRSVTLETVLAGTQEQATDEVPAMVADIDSVPLMQQQAPAASVARMGAIA